MAEPPSSEPAVPSMPPPDPDALKRYAFNLFTKLEGAVTSGMVHLGDRLGLYRCLAARADAVVARCTSAAGRPGGLDERWVREWAFNQGAAKPVESSIDGERQRFSLSAEALAVLVDESSPAFGMGRFTRFPGLIATLDEMPAAFRSGPRLRLRPPGERRRGGDRALVRAVVPQLPAAGRACRRSTASSAGWNGAAPWPTSAAGPACAVCLMAEAFPAVRSTATRSPPRAGARPSVGKRRSRAWATPTSTMPAASLCRRTVTARPGDDVRLHPRHDSPAGDDGIHPRSLARRRHAGSWSTSRRATPSHENRTKNPMAALMYGDLGAVVPVVGAVGARRRRARHARAARVEGPRAMAEAAGFTRFRRLDIDHADQRVLRGQTLIQAQRGRRQASGVSLD